MTSNVKKTKALMATAIKTTTKVKVAVEIMVKKMTRESLGKGKTMMIWYFSDYYKCICKKKKNKEMITNLVYKNT